MPRPPENPSISGDCSVEVQVEALQVPVQQVPVQPNPSSLSFDDLFEAVLQDVTALSHAHHDELSKLKFQQPTGGQNGQCDIEAPSPLQNSAPTAVLLEVAKKHLQKLHCLHEEFEQLVLAHMQTPSKDFKSRAGHKVAMKDVSFCIDQEKIAINSNTPPFTEEKTAISSATPSSKDSKPDRLDMYRKTIPKTCSQAVTFHSNSSSTVPGVLQRGLSDIVKKSIFNGYSKRLSGKEHDQDQEKQDEPKISDLAYAKGWESVRIDLKASDKELSGLGFFVLSRTFDMLCAFVILSNSLFLGLATDQSARQDDPDKLPLFYDVFDHLFTAWFIIELGLRAYAVGVCDFFFSPQWWRWNVFDCIVVVLDLVDTTSQIVTGPSDNGLQNFTAVRMIRVLRIARAIRVVRLIRMFKDLRLMVMAILRSGASLVWAVILISILIYIFAVFLLQNVVYYLHDHRNQPLSQDAKFLKDNFGTLIESCFTLFQAVSGGISWHEVVDPLITVHWTNGLVFCFYIFFTLFAMLNIVTGIFVESAMSSVQHDHEEVISEQAHNENSTLQKLKRLFMEADHVGAGDITIDEFQRHLQQPAVRAQLSALGLDVHEAHGVFKLLDLDGSGTISIDEFVYGCMRMKGHAKNLDLTTLLYEHKRMAVKWRTFFEFVKKEFVRHEEFEHRIEVLVAATLQRRAIQAGSSQGIWTEALTSMVQQPAVPE